MTARAALASALALGGLAASVLVDGGAGAETLPDAIVDALDTSPALGAERARVDAVRESQPIAWAEALPQVSLDASAIRTKRSEPTLAFLVQNSPKYWIASIHTSTLLFGSGRVWSSTRQARAQVANAVALYQDAAQKLILEVTHAYGDYRRAQAVQTAQDESVENLEAQLRFVTANVEKGFLTQTDLAQARARAAQAHADAALAGARVVEAHEAYLRLVGHAPLALEAPASLSDLPGDIDAALDIAGRENPTIVAAAAAVDAADAGVGVSRANGRLRVTLETDNSVFDKIDAPTVRDQSEDTVSLRLAMPLFSGGGLHARTMQQRYYRTAAQADLTEAQRRTHESVMVSWSSLNAARARLDATRTRVAAAEVASKGIRREQDFGQRSTIDVLNQEQELLTARIDLAQAEEDAMIAERTMAASIGRLAALSAPDTPVGQAKVSALLKAKPTIKARAKHSPGPTHKAKTRAVPPDVRRRA
jgi:outer membrane protein